MSEIKLKNVLERELSNRKISLRELSTRCSIPRSTLHDWISGRIPNSKNLHHLKSLSLYLEISVTTLLFNVDDKIPEKEILVSSAFKDDGKKYTLTIVKESKE